MNDWTPVDIEHSNSIVREILGERARQRGRYSKAHDDAHPPSEWVALLAEHLGTAATYRRVGRAYRMGLIAVAALAIAAVEVYDRTREHAQGEVAA